MLAGILRTDRDSHRRLHPNNALTQQIAAQVRLIETLRRSIQRQENQLRAVLLRTYPTALGLFGSLTAQINLEFLIAHPTTQDAQTVSREAFATFCQEHHYTRTDKIAKRYAHLLEPVPSANQAVLQAYQGHVQILAAVLLAQVCYRAQAIARLGVLFDQQSSATIGIASPRLALSRPWRVLAR